MPTVFGKKYNVQHGDSNAIYRIGLLKNVNDYSQQSCMPVKTFGDIPILRDIVKPYTFFKCFKGKKIEACMKKDMRQKFLALLTGASSGRAKQSREYDASEKEENIESIFNMVYGFDMNKSSDDIF